MTLKDGMKRKSNKKRPFTALCLQKKIFDKYIKANLKKNVFYPFKDLKRNNFKNFGLIV